MSDNGKFTIREIIERAKRQSVKSDEEVTKEAQVSEEQQTPPTSDVDFDQLDKTAEFLEKVAANLPGPPLGEVADEGQERDPGKQKQNNAGEEKEAPTVSPDAGKISDDSAEKDKAHAQVEAGSKMSTLYEGVLAKMAGDGDLSDKVTSRFPGNRVTKGGISASKLPDYFAKGNQIPPTKRIRQKGMSHLITSGAIRDRSKSRGDTSMFKRNSGSEWTISEELDRVQKLASLYKAAETQPAADGVTADNSISPEKVQDMGGTKHTLGGTGGGSSPATSTTDGQTEKVQNNAASLKQGDDHADEVAGTGHFIKHKPEKKADEGPNAKIESLIGEVATKSAEQKREELAKLLLDPEKAAQAREVLAMMEEQEKLAGLISNEELEHLQSVIAEGK
jgi:hypothetical protein